MLNERQLMQISQLLKAAEVDCHFLSIEEIEDLQQAVDYDLHQRQIISFKEHLEKSMPSGPNSTPEQQAALDAAFDKFYSTDWRVSFGNKSVKLHNCALVYNGIEELLIDVLDEEI